jgi:hypothetical protein
MFSLKNGSRIGGIILSLAVDHAKDGFPVIINALELTSAGSLSIYAGLRIFVFMTIPGSFSGRLKNVPILSELIIASDMNESSMGSITIAKLSY